MRPRRAQDGRGFGDGAVGLCAVTAAKQMGAERIIAMSRHANRQELTLEFGVTDIVTGHGDEGVAKIEELTGGPGAHPVVEAVGTQESMMQAIQLTRAGGHAGFVGVTYRVELPGMDLFWAAVRPDFLIFLLTQGCQSGLLSWTAYTIKEEIMKDQLVVELAIGKVNPGVSREAYLQAAVAVEGDLRSMPGFRSRRLLAGEGGLWVDLVIWDSLEEALQAAEAFQNIPSALPMINLLDPDTIRMYHLDLVYEDTVFEASPRRQHLDQGSPAQSSNRSQEGSHD